MRRKKPDYLLFKNSMVLHLNKLESPSPKIVLCQVLEKKILKFCQCNFATSYLSSFGNGRGPSFQQT